ncbi:MAG: thiamine phosphate synthase [Actinobacteria bacterium]|nr:thiamine phosphate synthase [Actinomycetota bacterium]
MTDVVNAPALDGRRLYLVCDASFEQAEAALTAGVEILQLRDRTLDDGELLRRASELAELAHRHGALFFVNDRPDIALVCGADGVHVGQADLPTSAIRELAGDRLLIGRSTHTPKQIQAALAESNDYLSVGPVHATPTKPGRPAVGLELVAHAAATVSRPWFAIGGIDATTLPAVTGAGATRVAVVRAVTDDADPAAATIALKRALGDEPARGS